jgi:transposase
LLLPHLDGVVIEEIADDPGGGVVVHARTGCGGVECPGCGTSSSMVHSRYQRTLRDLGAAGLRVRVLLVVRRLFCRAAACGRVTFVEQVRDVTTKHGRWTVSLRRVLERIGVAVAGRAGAGLAADLGVVVSRSTILRMVRALPDPDVRTVTVLGVDDFALRKGQVYGTVLVDMDTHQPVDLLPDREAGTFAVWLRQHPGTTVICRDRAGGYAAGGRAGAPEAVQVADRWHLWRNLGEHVEKTVAQHRTALTPHPQAPAGASPPAISVPTAEVPMVEKRIVSRTRDRYAQVQQLQADGMSKAAISRTLGLDVQTVRRFANATDVTELLIKSQQRASVLDAFVPYLHDRVAESFASAAQLAREITQLGYRGSEQTVRRFLSGHSRGTTGPVPRPKGPTVREVTGWIMRNPATHTDKQRHSLAHLRETSPHLDAVTTLVSEFADMMLNRRGEHLETWLNTIETSDLTHLRSFAAGIRNDQAAVTNGLTLEHNSGTVEGTVNKIKMLKRQMYGRANLDLLRKRLLHLHGN